MPAEIVVPMFVLQFLVLAGALVGAFIVGRWYQRRRNEGLSKSGIIDLAKSTAEAELVQQYEAGVTQVKALAERIKALRSQ
jgi:hypothetical protein